MTSRQQCSFIPSEAEMRTAVRTRDASYDQIFFYGVVTTGVFCVPSCAARPARPENIRFYVSAAEAEQGGMRPCQRCRPLEAATEVDNLLALARELAADPGERMTLTDMAHRTGMSPARFKNRFQACFGVTPAEFRDGARFNTFKAALARGASVADAVYTAGFGSTSRVYDVSSRNLGMTPTSYRAGAHGETISYAVRNTSLGTLLMAATARGVCFAEFGDSEAALLEALEQEFPRATLQPSASEDSIELDAWIQGLEDHIGARAPRPDLPLDLRGSAFQIQVWRYLLSVPEGDVISYADVATGIGRPGAVRAAASACGANRIAVLIPCHRVLRGDGALGGYRWGAGRKAALLDAERAAPS